MRSSTTARINLVWGFLSTITIVSWLLATARVNARFSPSTSITVAVVAAAALKGRLVMQHFMEVRTSPIWLRRVTDAWLATLSIGVLALYLY
jgi:hypothetical protein